MLTPLQVKEVPLPVAPVRFNTSENGKQGEAIWQPLVIQVTTVVSTTDLAEMREATSIEDLPPVPAGEGRRWWAVGFGAVLILGVVAAAWLVRRRRLKPAVSVPPHAWAQRELQRIAVDHPNGDVELYYAQLSDVVRRYLELRFGLRASEQTTGEFLHTLQRGGPLAPPHQELLRELLQRCDLAKFARATFTPEECQAANEMAQRLVQETADSAP